jgi:phosphatidate cytidylyltransferase
MTDKNRNLVVRLATAAVLLPLVLWLIWQGGLPFAILIGVAAAGCALELNLLPSHLPKQESAVQELELETASLSGAGIVSMAAAFVVPFLHEIPFVPLELVISILVIVAFADALFFEAKTPLAPRRVGLAVLGALYPGVLLGALVPLRQFPNGFWWVFLALTVTWANDTGAYFAGRALGKHKLYPRISPSKTWEGAIGGALASILGACIVQHFALEKQLALPVAALIGAGAAVLGPIGDFSESMLKRAFGAKDSGRLLPGHGGLLDRIDALLFNAPFVLLCARLWA